MANGQQKAQQNLEAFEIWKATQTDDDFTQIVYRGQLNRSEVAKAIACGKSALNQNPALKKALLALEDELRGKGILPPLTDAAKKNEDNPKAYDNTASRRSYDAKYMAELEAENVELKAKIMGLQATIDKYEADLKRSDRKQERFSEMKLVMYEYDGVMPR